MVGVHDIFLPHDYPSDWLKRFYSEQYLLASWLLGGTRLQTELPVFYCTKTPHLHRLPAGGRPRGLDRHRRPGLRGADRGRRHARAARRGDRPPGRPRRHGLPLPRRPAPVDLRRRGWNLTGDAFRMDDDGYFWFQARTDDMIVSSGYNISGAEVEAALLEHPAVGDCAVVASPDEERGHVVKAFVVLASGAVSDAALVTELQDHVKARIAPYKYPRRIEFLDALPRTTTGKVQRTHLRAMDRAES